MAAHLAQVSLSSVAAFCRRFPLIKKNHHLVFIRVLNPHHFNADPDLVFHFHLGADPDPAFHFKASCTSSKMMAICDHWFIDPPSFVSVLGPPRLCFEPFQVSKF
jgi:hypothetical protein